MSKENQNKEPKKLEELSQEELIAKVNQLEDDKAGLEKLNEELNAALEESESKPSGKNPVFKVGKDSYELIAAKSKYKGNEITAKVLKQDEELLKELVKIKAGILRAVKKGGSE